MDQIRDSLAGRYTYRTRRIHRIPRRCPNVDENDFVKAPEDMEAVKDIPLIFINGEWVDGNEYFGTTKAYIHEQDVAEAAWIIEHNLGMRLPRVVAFNSAGIKIIGVCSEQDTDENTYVLCFSRPVAGTAALFGG